MLDRLHKQVDALVLPVDEELAKAYVWRVGHDLARDVHGKVVAYHGFVEEGAVEHPLVVSTHVEHIEVARGEAVLCSDVDKITFPLEQRRRVSADAQLGLRGEHGGIAQAVRSTIVAEQRKRSRNGGTAVRSERHGARMLVFRNRCVCSFGLDCGVFGGDYPLARNLLLAGVDAHHRQMRGERCRVDVRAGCRNSVGFGTVGQLLGLLMLVVALGKVGAAAVRQRAHDARRHDGHDGRHGYDLVFPPSQRLHALRASCRSRRFGPRRSHTPRRRARTAPR